MPTNPRSTSQPVNQLEALNRQFSLGESLRFIEGPGGLSIAELNTARATASVALHGGQVLSFQPAGSEAVLWMSEFSEFRRGKAIRGGIPVCWPWFGPHPEDAKKPAHGFARVSVWSVFAARLIDNEDVQLRLRLDHDALTRSHWPHEFELETRFTLSDRLRVELFVRNIGQEAFSYTSALHTYLNVSHINEVAVYGLDGCEYVDQLVQGPLKRQNGPIRFSEETDRIYVDTPHSCVLEDAGFGRRIFVEKTGSLSTVVWNPWIAKASRMSDFGNEEYKRMVCIETANAAHHVVNVPAGRQHATSATLRVENI